MRQKKVDHDRHTYSVLALAERGGLSERQFSRLTELQKMGDPKKLCVELHAELQFLQKAKQFGHPGEPFSEWHPGVEEGVSHRFVWPTFYSECELGKVTVYATQAGYTVSCEGAKVIDMAQKHVITLSEVKAVLFEAVSLVWKGSRKLENDE